MIYKANNIQEIFDSILKIKNLTPDTVQDFIDCKIPFRHPFHLTKMQEVSERVIEAIHNNEIVTIVGDYDVDGITSTYILYDLLRQFIKTNYIIPHRINDGYGISKNIVDRAKELSTDLIITVDNGISEKKAIEYAQSIGIQVIVTDHHPSKDIPIDLTVDPNVENYNTNIFSDICGCMVAFKLAYSILKHFHMPIPKEYIELTALATIADVMPLIDENRLIVKQGIELLKNSFNVGLLMLISALNMEVNIHNISFSLIPCLNSAGRMEHANLAMKLLLEEDEYKAYNKAKYLIELNNKRKELQNNALSNMIINNEHKVVFGFTEVSIQGIAGIVASQLMNRYNKPAIAFAIGKDNYSGSGRSNGYPLNKLIDNNVILGGGHELACGISVNKKDINFLYKNVDELQYVETAQEINAIQISSYLINEGLYTKLQSFEPYGYGNEKVLFYTPNVYLSDIKRIGKDKNYTKFTVDNKFNAIYFNTFDGDDRTDIYANIYYYIEMNEFPKDVFTLQLNIQQVKVINTLF